MTKQEQIEEIAKFVCNSCEMKFCIDGDCAVGNDYKTCGISQETAEYIYNAGYRKIDDKCAVITKDELNLYKKQREEIERLTKDKSFATRKMMESKAKAVELQKKVDELKEENKTILNRSTMWKHLHTEVCEENAELQKQVDELLNRKIEPKIIECHGMLKGCDMVNQAVKDTAKEILEQVRFLIEERNCVGGYDLEDETIDGTIFVEVLNELKERYGVEVEE